MQAVPTSGPSHRNRIKPGSLNQHIGRRSRNHRIPAAHHSCQSERFGMVRNHQVFWIQLPLNAVESLQLFALAGTPDDDSTLNFVEIKCVSRLTHGQPRKIRRIDSVENLLLLEECEIPNHLARQWSGS